MRQGGLIYSSIVYFLGSLSLLRPHVEVDTHYGRIRGAKAIARNGRPYIEFLNVPYAKPPTGALRFEPPQEPISCNDVLDATYFGNSCLQYEYLTHMFTGSEDCLNINIYTHKTVKYENFVKQNEALKPVIVFFYGGGFMSGFNYVYRAKYFMEEDVVLVTVNYRVNSFGFLNMGDETIRGNMGLKDQVMALRWVQKNIRYFGGNSNSVTIMGQSAGAGSVHYHMMSKMSTGLFHRAISLSGTALAPWSFSKHPAKQARTLAKHVGCYDESTTVMTACLKKLNPIRIEEFHKNYLEPIPDPLTLYGPSIESQREGAFLTEDPRYILEHGLLANQVPWITGVANDEGNFFTAYMMVQPKIFEELAADWNEVLTRKYGDEIHTHGNASEISNAIRQFYFGNEEPTPKAFQHTRNPFTDKAFYVPLIETLRLHLRISTAPTYAYYYTYTREYSVSNFLRSMPGYIPMLLKYTMGASRTWLESRLNSLTVKNRGAEHGDDLTTLFNIPTIGDEITPGSKDYRFSSEYVKLLVSFACNGKPGKLFGVEWEPVNANKNDKLQLFEIGSNPKMLPVIPFQKIIDFWDSLNI